MHRAEEIHEPAANDADVQSVGYIITPVMSKAYSEASTRGESTDMRASSVRGTSLVSKVNSNHCKEGHHDNDNVLGREITLRTNEDAFSDEEGTHVAGLQAIPDGGIHAYLVVLGSFCAMVATFGVSNSFGPLQDYILRNQLKDYSDSDVGWIFSIWLFIMYFGGVQVGPIFDAYGLRPLLVPGCLGWAASLMILSVCKEYYQFILGFSILGGISTSMVFNPAITVLGHWFIKHRGLATGISIAGGSVGGIYMPLMLNKLLPEIGYGWAVRTMAFIIVGLLTVSCATMESRNLRRRVDFREAMIDLRSLRIKEYTACVFGVFLVEWGFFIPILYLVAYARAQGLSPGYSNALIAYLNVGSTLGRALPGYFADKFGPYNVIVVTSGLTGILCLALWLPAGHTKAGLTTFSVLFGFWSGSTVSITPLCVAEISDTKEYGKRYGTAYSIASLAALTGVPIAGSMTDNNYLGVIVFGGVSYVVGTLSFILSRWWAAGARLKF